MYQMLLGGNVMRVPRRRFLHLGAAAGAFAAVSRIALAQSYPSRPIHWIVLFTAGGPNDTVARIIGQYLSERLGQQVLIENKVGAGGNIGMAAVLSSPPDGYTIGFAAPNNAINATLYEKLPFDFVRDSVPVAGTMLLTNVMVVHPDVPAKTVADFIAYAKAVPTISETVPGYEAVVWYGIVAPKGTPPETVNILNAAVNAVLADPKLKARLAELGGEAMTMSPAEFGKLIASETEKWAKVVKFSGAKAE